MELEARVANSDRRLVSGRTFEKRNGVWTDVAAGSKTVVHIEPFSDAYFALLRALPELAPIWKQLPSSVTAGKRVAIGLKTGGRKQISPQELSDLVARFRS